MLSEVKVQGGGAVAGELDVRRHQDGPPASVIEIGRPDSGDASGVVGRIMVFPVAILRPLASLSLTANPGFSGGYIVFPGPPLHPCPEPMNVLNRCSLKPLTPETPEKALLLVCSPRRSTLQVVCRRRPRFQLPDPSSQTRWPTQALATAARMRLGNTPGTELLPGFSGSGNHPRWSKEDHPNTSPGRNQLARPHRALRLA
jgi:hypothetical protein